MNANEIRRKFLAYFEGRGHAVRPSSGLVPDNDPTLLFTNAGMVQFKRVFVGREEVPFDRATTSQKCLRVSGKHNDLEEVGVTARHHTFFEMLGNFSFGDYFKREAITFAWELLTEEYGLPRERLWATVHHSDDEAFELWREVAGLPDSRIFRLGDKDNFWQMGDTGPCGPCSELHFDLRPEAERGTDVARDEFVEQGERGLFLELWNLVFMQFDRGADGELSPLPAPSIDTGAGLERLASVLQGVDSNYKTDLFTPLIERAESVVGVPYEYEANEGVSYRVLADHARAVAFLLADGVFPSNEGRGYVLRRVLRRAARHAWLLGRREPTLVEVVDEVAARMGGAFPELEERRDHLLRATRAEEERFLATIQEGMERFDEIAPVRPGRAPAGAGGAKRGAAEPRPEPASKPGAGEPAPVIAAAEAFKLHDTYGFPLDLTELMARERGYTVDVEGFEAALEEQRERSRRDRAAGETTLTAEALAEGWEELEPDAEQEFVGYDTTSVETEIVAFRRENGRLAVQLRANPFYAEAGGQVSDRGMVTSIVGGDGGNGGAANSGVDTGGGWTLAVDDVRRVAGRVAVLGDVNGEFPAEPVGPVAARAAVAQPARHDTERNHTATHLLHAALRKVLGEHVVQRGSLVAPDRLRFDFSHPRPMTPDEIRAVEEETNRAIFADEDVCGDYLGYEEAVDRGAMALFGEKYEDVVRVIEVPGVSLELCGGTHVRHTGEIALLRITRETGVSAGVRRIEAVTGPDAYRRVVDREELLGRAAGLLKATPEALLGRIEQLIDENRGLERRLESARAASAADTVGDLVKAAGSVDGTRLIATQVEVATSDELRALGDRLRSRLESGAAVLAARYTGEDDEGKMAFFAVVTDDLVERGVRADALVRGVAELTGGGGGGRPHMAQGGVGDPDKVRRALEGAPEILRGLVSGAGDES